GDTVVFSATPIPGNERAVNETIDRLYHIGCEVITPRDAPVHASGHGYAEEVKLMLNLVKPRYVMPFHGDFKRLRMHAKLAEAVVIFRGVPFRDEADKLLGEIRLTVDETLSRASADDVHEVEMVQQMLHEDLAQLVYDRLRRRPMVLPVVVEV